MSEPGHQCSPACEAASEIAIWQVIALQLPLPELMEMASDSRNGLAHSLNDFNDMCQDGTPDPGVLERTVTEVSRRATAAAIFALGLCQRRREEAALN